MKYFVAGVLIVALGSTACTSTTQPQKPQSLYQMAVAKGWHKDGFAFYAEADPKVLSDPNNDTLIWNVPDYTADSFPSKGPCEYLLLLKVQTRVWYFQLRKKEVWSLGKKESYKSGINWRKPPTIESPTPDQAWGLVKRYWDGTPDEVCNPHWRELHPLP